MAVEGVRKKPVDSVKNKRLKVSPGGVITLPVAARKALGMAKGAAARVSVSVDSGEVVFSARPAKGSKSWRVSAAGMFLLKGEAKDVLSSGKNRHYWLKLSDKTQEVRAVPYK